jgi:hypothetical protein
VAAATGFGKSLIYQVPGVLTGRLTVVVSPLLALQQDQLDNLPDQVRHRAARLSSMESAASRTEIFDRAASGEIVLLASTPEQIAAEDVRRQIARVRPGLVAVDEAHSVSTCATSRTRRVAAVVLPKGPDASQRDRSYGAGQPADQGKRREDQTSAARKANQKPGAVQTVVCSSSHGDRKPGRRWSTAFRLANVALCAAPHQ